jgi:ureidoglycolate lyase
MILEPRPLTRADFAPFGDVIEAEGRDPEDMNHGMAERWPRLACIDAGTGGQACIGLVHARRYSLPHRLEIVERHPLGSQAFFPLHDRPFLVVVARAGEPPTAADLNCFITNGSQGVHYHTGVWHGLLLTALAEMDFLVVDRAGPGENCEEHRFAESDAPWIQLPQ